MRCLLPLIVIELVLMLTALVHVIRHQITGFGNKAIWVIIVVLIQVIGPILYFVFGRGEEE